jgi:hypothetical protein
LIIIIFLWAQMGLCMLPTENTLTPFSVLSACCNYIYIGEVSSERGDYCER